MALGSNTGTAKTYLSVGFGKLRQKQTESKQKVDATTPNAVCRKTQAGAESWAIEHDFVSGKIDKIFYKEDAEYGNSFEVVISDALDTYQLSFSDNNRFWFDFMKKLPNVDLSKEVKITVYDFKDKTTGKTRAGVSIEQGGKKITSYYDKQNDDKSWTLLHGFPSGKDVDFKDKDELKIYFIKVKKFLNNQFFELFGDTWTSGQAPATHDEFDNIPPPPEPPTNEDESDLPW